MRDLVRLPSGRVVNVDNVTTVGPFMDGSRDIGNTDMMQVSFGTGGASWLLLEDADARAFAAYLAQSAHVLADPLVQTEKDGAA